MLVFHLVSEKRIKFIFSKIAAAETFRAKMVNFYQNKMNENISFSEIPLRIL